MTQQQVLFSQASRIKDELEKLQMQAGLGQAELRDLIDLVHDLAVLVGIVIGNPDTID